MLNSNICVFFLLLIITKSTTGCYTSIFAFGDSLTDNGNFLLLSAPKRIHQGNLPNGETYFHHPTGRCCDGRLVVDILAQHFGVFPPPYVETKISNSADIHGGVNFAVAGARALDNSFYYKNWNDYCHKCLPESSDCKELLQRSLVLMGEIGGDDYNHPLIQGRALEEVRSFVPLVVRAIGSAINELIELGVVTLMVPGNLPFGCSAALLTYFQSFNKNDYDGYGCIRWLNKLSMYHNKLLQLELHRLRQLHPHATIIYADYYNAAIRLYHSPSKYGFTNSLAACCGAGGPYNFNESAACGDSSTTSCNDPSSYVCWDGLHLTEAANRWIAKGILEGPYADPPIDPICTSLPTSAQLL